MTLFHISDLHLGKRVGSHDITEDMRHILFGEILDKAVEMYSPDGIIVAGDIYDTVSPPPESVRLFDEFITAAVGKGLSVYMISGNHDNPQLVSYGRTLLKNSGVHISRPYSADGVVVVQAGDYDIALLPHISMEQIRACYPEETVEDMSVAVRLVLKKAGIPHSERPCVLVAHLAVGTGAAVIGKLDNVAPSVFEGFAYTALGHYHSSIDCGNNVKYSGAPLCFNRGDAAKPQKYLDILTLSAEGVSREQYEFSPKRGARIIRDTLENILSDIYPASDDYIWFIVTQTDEKMNVAERIAAKFPCYVSIDYATTSGKSAQNEEQIVKVKALDFGELFKGFASLVRGEEPDEELTALAAELFSESKLLVEKKEGGAQDDT